MDVKLSQLNRVDTAELTDLFEISRAIGGVYESNSLSYQGLIHSIHGARVISVNKSGTADFDTIKEAIAYASTIASATNSISILVYPGTYLEDNPLVLPSYVNLRSIGGQFTTAIGGLNNGIILQTGYRAIVTGFSIQATASAGYLGSTGIYMPAPLSVIENCVLVNCENGIWSDGGLADSSVIIDSAILNFTTSKVVRGFYATNGSKLVLKTSLTNSTNPANLIDYGLYCDNATIYCAATNFSECGSAVYCDNGGNIEINSAYIYTGLNGLVVGPNGNDSGINAVGVSMENTVSQYHVVIESVTGHIDLIGGYESYKRSIVSGATFHSYAQDESTQGSTIIGNTRVEDRFDVGLPGKNELGLEIGMDIGTGKSYALDKDGVPIVEYWTYDDSAASGSRFTRMANNAGTILTDDGDALIVGSKYDYSSLKLNVDQAANLGSTSIITEHWDGSQWVEHFTATYSNSDFTHRQNNFFQNVESQYVEHGFEVYDDWDIADNILDEIPAWDLGTDMYAVRFRNNGGSLVTPAIISDGKVKSDDFSIQTSGEAVSWGRNRGSEIISIEAGHWDPDSVNPPSLVDIDVTSNISLTNHPSFLANSLCKASVFAKIPNWADTSTPLSINAGMFCPTTEVSGNLNITLRIAVIRSSLIVGSIPEEIYSITTTMSGIMNKLQNFSQEINIQEFQPGWNLLIGIERDATISNPSDTFSGDVTFMALGLYYTRKIVG